VLIPAEEYDPIGTAKTPDPYPASYQPVKEGFMDFASPAGPIDPPDPGTTVKMKEGWVLGIHPEMTDDDRVKMQSVIKECEGSFAYNMQEIPGYTQVGQAPSP
jgi:hypothetical protein